MLSILHQGLRRHTPRSTHLSARLFGTADHFNKELFEHKFTPNLEFKDQFGKERIPCFRVMDENGKIINKEYENSIDKE